ncbi:hypothetical protein D3C72_2396400 [compost metagenome]
MVNLPRAGTCRQKRQRYGCARSSSVGAAIGTMLYWRGSRAAATRRIAPPLPAASLPSNTAISAWRRMRLSRINPENLACSVISCSS